MTIPRASTLAVLLALTAAVPAQAYPLPGRTTRISLTAAGAEVGERSGSPVLSRDGHRAVFASDAALLPDDRNGTRDFYLRDLTTGDLELISVASDGTQADVWTVTTSNVAAISDDGRLVAFESGATTLVPGDTNGVEDVFVRDRSTGETTRVSVSASGQQAAAHSGQPQITGDGRYVFFVSEDDALVAGDVSPYIDIFRRDLQTGAVDIVNLDSNEQQSVFDPNSYAISRDGATVAWAAVSPTYDVPDSGPPADVFVRDLAAGTTTRISESPGGVPGNGNSLAPSLSADGRYVAFASLATNLVPGDRNRFVDIFVHDRQTSRTERVSVSSAGVESMYGGGTPSITADGRFVAFNGPGSDLSATPEGNTGTDSYVHDLATGATFPLSVTPGNSTGNALSYNPVLSADGSLAGFSSDASDLVPGDTNGHTDSFIRTVGPPVGVGDVDVDAGVVSGWSRFAGTALASGDSANDGTVQVRGLGGEIVGARAVWRPEEEDVFFRIDLAGLPFVPDGLAGPSSPPVGVQGIRYTVAFRIGDVPFQVRLDPVAGERAQPRLLRCDPGCTEIATVTGSLGDAGESLTASVPLSAIGVEPGVTLTGVTASTTLTTPAANTSGDTMTLGSLDLAAPRVEVGSTPAGTPASDVAFERVAQLSGGRFTASASGSGPRDVWARACLGTVCGAASVRVEG